MTFTLNLGIHGALCCAGVLLALEARVAFLHAMHKTESVGFTVQLNLQTKDNLGTI